MPRPLVIGVTLGDVNGVGPEVALKAAFRMASRNRKILLIGSADIAGHVARVLKLPTPDVCDPEMHPDKLPPVGLWDPAPKETLRYKPGRITAEASRAAATWIRTAADACLQGRIDAMVTAPICKEGFQAVGISAPGHTEMLAELTGTRRFAMMLFGGRLRVVLATRHVPLSRVAKSLSVKVVLNAIELTGEALPWMGWRRGRVAVCGLNPHAGDGGRLGREEIDIIAPAIRKAVAKGLDVVGPVPADTVFHMAWKGFYDAVVAMYHDQGLAPLKMLAFDVGVNVTLGLPIVRTSPDHGTAFDIAGRGYANPQSMMEAIRWAAKLAWRKNPWK